MEAYGSKQSRTGMEAYSYRSTLDKTPELHQQLGNTIADNTRNFIKDPILGNQNHRSDKLTCRQTKFMPGLTNMESTSGELRHRRTIES
eukprot:9046841-Heterocapsa_arctica.AAC.1